VQGDGISVQAIAGTHVVLFGMDVPRERIDGLMGFAIRRDQLGDRRQSDYLPNFLVFRVNDRGDDTNHSSRANPFQEFLWGDYAVRPERNYRYRVIAMYGDPGSVRPRQFVEFDVRTESNDDGTHGIFFNRGVVASQAYARRFGNRPPQEVGAEAYTWLSRGLAEGMTDFIAQAKNRRYGLRAAVYEFTYRPILDALADAQQKCRDVEIVYDCVDVAGHPGKGNNTAIRAEQIDAICTRRTDTTIGHNKFIVLLENNRPTQVWTGSTNITEGGIYGHSNVGHVVRDPAVARRYLDYWKRLQDDPASAALRQWTERTQIPPRAIPSGSITTVFSPRRGLAALRWYARLMDEAQTSAFLTGAFGVSAELLAVFREPKPYLRYLLLDKRKANVETVARNPSNRVTAGAWLGEGGWRQWLEEVTTRQIGLNRMVQYIHTKFMLIDPLSANPIVITGSANFSRPSTSANDENMLVISGNPRVADIYLGEFMRLFTHFRFRAMTRTPNERPAPGPLAPSPPRRGRRYLRNDDSWARRFYVKDSPREKERLLFR
jgi:phosphatidylserine/phosphatidylglycerophosphate/cardiolipin synthase-like enzyme